jgi:aminopeptidase
VLESEEIEDTILRDGSEEQLSYLDPMPRTAIEEVDVLIGLPASLNTRARVDIDPNRLVLHNEALEPPVETYLRQDALGSLRWIGGGPAAS